MERLRAGTVLVRNPVNHAQVQRVALSPDTVDCIVFWTKDPRNMTAYLDELDAMGYRYYFQFTLTPYGSDIEPGLRPKDELLGEFKRLSERIGAERVVWRYDPILMTEDIGVGYHKEQFERLCEELAGAKKYTDTAVISFVDIYPRIKSDEIRPPETEEQLELAAYIGRVAREHGIKAETCCESADLSQYGIVHTSCISQERIERICCCTLDIPPEKNQREGCRCRSSIDVGAYNTCVNGCVYCYATGLLSTAGAQHSAHDPKGELLAGTLGEDDVVTERQTRSYKSGQLSLF